MAWSKGLVIRGGEYAGATIGISTNLVGGSYAYAVGGFNDSAAQQVQDDPNIFYNYDFEKMISCSTLFALSGADFADECIADIAIVKDKQITGYFSLYATRSGLNVTVCGKVKNASGVVVYTFPQGASITIDGRVETTGYLCLAKGTVNNYTLYGLYFNNNQHWQWGGSDFGLKAYAGAWINDDRIFEFFGIDGHIDSDIKTKSPEFGEASEPEGGYNEVGGYPHGTWDFSSVDIPLDPKPNVGVTSAGFINVYKIGANELTSLGEKLFPHFNVPEFLVDPSSISVQEMLAAMLKAFFGSTIYPTGYAAKLADNLGVIDILMNGKLIDYVLDCHVLPANIGASTASPLKIGYRTFNEFQLAKATEDYVDIDCGSLSIDEVFGNYLDYTCHVELYLPFVGYVPIDNEYWNNAQINVVYRFNIIDGSFQAKVRVVKRKDDKMKLKNSVIGQYGGVCCVHFPITGLQYSNVVAGLVNGAGGLAASVASGNVGGAVTNAMNMAMLRPDVPMSNGYNASSSFLAQRTPYLVIKRDAPQFSENYPKEIGLPLNVTRQLSTVSGFTVIDNPVLHMDCSDQEYNEIVSLLKSGVIL